MKKFIKDAKDDYFPAVINSIEELKQYYTEDKKAFIFKEGVCFTIDIDISESIAANHIIGKNIKAKSIVCTNIIKADNISANTVDTDSIYILGDLKADKVSFSKFLSCDGKLIVTNLEKKNTNSICFLKGEEQ